ncbi:hypothetical protein LIER_07476 [Lithospermum erythrorhizon]|uniref:Uncharacterized protein n=1 Tax=Lithospermum erythrorhizon TaxID=34254 RepID=A0AAV3PA89_LITER
MDADLARVLGTLSLEGEVFVPHVAYDRVKEKYQFSLVMKVLTRRRFHVQSLKDTHHWKMNFQSRGKPTPTHR